MTANMIDRMERAFLKLIAALDEQHAEEIINAGAAVRSIILEADAFGACHPTEPMKRKLQRLSQLVDESRDRVKKLTDIHRHQLEILTQANGVTIPQTYQRPR